MMGARGVAVDHTTVYRWTQRYAPELEKRSAWYLSRLSFSWRVDEKAISRDGLGLAASLLAWLRFWGGFMAHVFISYVRENADLIAQLSDTLSSFGINVWLDRDRIQAGSRWKDAVRDAIAQGAFFLACFSTAYLERSKTYMNEELTLAIEELRQRPTDQTWFIPVLLEKCEVPRRTIGAGEILSDIQYIKLYDDWVDGVRRILSVIQPISSMEFSLRLSLSDSSARARISAADNLGRMGPAARESAPALVPLLHDENETVQAAAAEALGKIGVANKEIVQALLEITPDNGHRFYPSKHASKSLVSIGASAIPYLIDVFVAHGNNRNTVGEVAMKTLANIGEPALPHLGELLRSGDDNRRQLAADVIARIQKRPSSHNVHDMSASCQTLMEMLRADSKAEHGLTKDFARASAANALASLGDPIAIPALIEALNDPNYVCVSAALALGRMKHTSGVEPLIRVLKDRCKFWVPRGAAAVALGLMGPPAKPALPALREALGYEGANETWDLRAREAVEDAICHITDPSADCMLTGKGYRFEMWGIY